MNILEDYEIVREQAAREFADIGWRVEMKRYLYHCSFACFEIGDQDDDDQPAFFGDVKWDGCSNWSTDPDCMMHFCHRHQLIEFGELLARLYDWAGEYFPDLTK